MTRILLNKCEVLQYNTSNSTDIYVRTFNKVVSPPLGFSPPHGNIDDAKTFLNELSEKPFKHLLKLIHSQKAHLLRHDEYIQYEQGIFGTYFS